MCFLIAIDCCRLSSVVIDCHRLASIIIDFLILGGKKENAFTNDIWWNEIT